MDLFHVFLVFLVFSAVSCSNKYSKDLNNIDNDPFRMMKINLIWNKAKMRLPKENLVLLYQDLKQQDQLEADLKKKKAAGQDEDGEFEALVTRKSLDLILKYGLESIHPDAPTLNNQVYDHQRQDSERWQKAMSDKKLNKLWKKAQLSGFTDQELAALRGEFLHHVNKLDELNVLHSDLNEITNEKIQENSIADYNRKQDQREAQSNLKHKHRQVRDGYARIEDQITTNKDGLSDKVAGGFRHPKVIDLWFSARNGNFTEEELESIKEELHHFEHKVTKLEHLQEEHGIVDAKMNQKNLQLSDYPEKQYKLADKVKEYTHKVKKYETDLRQRIDIASRHNEL